LETRQREYAELHRRDGIATERLRMSQEIHDTLAQGLSSIVMLLESADTRLAGDVTAETARRSVRLAHQTARENLDEARSLITNSRPAALAAETLPAALSRICSRAGENGSFQVSFRRYGALRALPAHVDVVAVRVLQEALANVTAHAAARSVNVELHDDDVLRLVIRDDGCGFDPSQPATGYGLVGMRERAEQLGGRVWVSSEVGSGTTVELVIP
jgi:signal transduction histidine kinase